MLRDLLLIGLGILLLYGGGEALVHCATRVAILLRVSPLVIGLTLVAFGTSAPELAATMVASFKGLGDVAFGNIVGSNIANLGLVLGLSALVRPVKTTYRFVTQEMPFMLFTAGLLFVLAKDGHLGRAEGLFFLSFLGLFLVFLMKRDAAISTLRPEERERPLKKIIFYICGVFLGVGLLSFGANVLVDGAVGLARHFGVPERVIGLTLVAVGTSLPELVSTLVAAYRRAGDLILGNIIGSNIMNVLAILGLTPLVHPFSFSRTKVIFDLTVMMGFSFAAWGLLAYHKGLGRFKGALLFGSYLLYVFYLYR